MASEDSDLMEYLQAGKCQVEGLLMKLSSKNVWQKRYYQIRGPYLMYWATAAASKKGPSNGCEVSTPNVSIDLRLIRDADVLTGQVLILTSKSGQMFSLKPVGKEKILAWVDNINEQIKQEEQTQTTSPSERKYSRQTVMVLNQSMREGEEGGEGDEPNTTEAMPPLAESKYDEDTAATKVQAMARSKLSKKKVETIKEEKKQEKASVSIQKIQRKKAAAKKVEAKRAEKKEKEQDEKKVVKLQGLIRQKEAKKKVELKRQEISMKKVEEEAEAAAKAAEEREKEADFRGVLEKQGHFVNTGFRKRMFVLTRDKNDYFNLSYYEYEGGRLGDKRGEIELKLSNIITSETDETDFTIKCPDKTYPLKALSLESAAEWKRRLNKAIESNNNNTLGSATSGAPLVSAITEAGNGEAVANANGGNNGGPSYRGVLEKAGHFLNTAYKKRLFVLTTAPPSDNWVMFYYVEAGAGRLGELKGEIHLKGAKIEKGLALNEFTVAAKDKSFPLRAADDASANKWMEKIQQAIDLCA